MRHIYVSNLQFSATKDEIQALFRNYGQVYSITLLRDAAPSRRRLFALVEMPNDAESARAIAALNGFELGGLHLSVSGGLSLGANSANRLLNRPKQSGRSTCDSTASQGKADTCLMSLNRVVVATRLFARACSHVQCAVGRSAFLCPVRRSLKSSIR